MDAKLCKKYDKFMNERLPHWEKDEAGLSKASDSTATDLLTWLENFFCDDHDKETEELRKLLKKEVEKESSKRELKTF